MPPSPRVLILVTLAEIGGTVEYVSALLPALVEDFDVTVAAWGPGPLPAAAEQAGAPYIPLRNVRRDIHPWRDLLGLIEVIRLVRKVRPQILHTNNAKAGFFGRIAGVFARVPVRIHTAHGWAFTASPGFAAWLYRFLERLMRPLTTTVVCVSESGREVGLAAGVCLPERTVVIKNAIDVGRARRASRRDGTPLILSVGRLKPPKDFLTLVRALGALEPSSFRCSIVGDGPGRPELETEIRRLGLEQSVELAGEREDVPGLLAGADIFVLSSTSEGMPISIIEAMAAGLPVVATSAGGIPELVEEGITGFLVPARDENALARALARLLSEPELRRHQGEAACARAQREFDLPTFRRAHVELYRSLLEDRGLDSSSP